MTSFNLTQENLSAVKSIMALIRWGDGVVRRLSLLILVLIYYVSIVSSFSLQKCSLVRRTGRLDLSPLMATATAKARMQARWFPMPEHQEGVQKIQRRMEIEEQALELASILIENRLRDLADASEPVDVTPNRAFDMAKGRFQDLTCTESGDRALESLFHYQEAAEEPDDDVILGAIYAVQSLCIMGTQVSVRGTEEHRMKLVAHLQSRYDASRAADLSVWTPDSIRRLKHKVEQSPGTQLLAYLRKKRTSQGAFQLLVDLGAWHTHEDVTLLRSGFPVRFTPTEEAAAKTSSQSQRDPDALLGLRRDLRSHKVYTIDSSSTNDIDDGLSVETFIDEEGNTRERLWIHIADADRWAPRDSAIFETARARAISLYLPQGTVPMFPSR